MKADDFLKALYFANDLMKRIFIKVNQTEYYITSIRPGFKRNTEQDFCLNVPGISLISNDINPN